MSEDVKKEGSYLSGIIGAIIGGAIATIPWVLVYVYGNLMLSLLALLIGAGEFYGYKLFKGKLDKKLPIIIIVLALIIVTIATLLVIPAMLLNKNNLEVSFNSIKNLYTYNNFISGIMRDYIISVLFTVLGAGTVAFTIKKQLLNVKDVKDLRLDLSNTTEQIKLKEESIKMIKPIFEKYNATSNDNTLTKEEVFAEVEKPGKNVAFNCLKNLGIIKKVNGRYYYSLEDESNTKEKTSSGKVVAIIFAIIIVILIAIGVYSNLYMDGGQTIWNDDISFTLEDGWTPLENSSQENEWTYYKYLGELPQYSTNIQGENEQVDYKLYPETLVFSYEQQPTDTYNTIDELKTSLETYVKDRVVPAEYSITNFTTNNGYEALELYLKYMEEPEEINYIYYIRNSDGRLAYFTAATFNFDDQEDLREEALNIINTFKWEN